MPERLGYRPSLDGVRALAVLAVLAIHGGAPVPGGFLGVDVFFVLSGFLITSLLADEWERRSTIALRDFYVRRARRLLPALIATIIGVAIIYALFQDVGRGVGFGAATAAVLAYVGNWVEAAHSHAAAGNLGALDHTWSLAIEEQFYLLWPPALILLLRRGWGPRRLTKMLCALALLSIALRVLTWWHVLPLSPYFATHTHADGILLGCALAFGWRDEAIRSRIRRVASSPAAGAALLVVLVAVLTLHTTDSATYVAGFTVVALSTALVIAHVLAQPDARVTRLLARRPLVWIGARSYGIYLYHLPLFMVLTRERLHLRYAELLPVRVLVTVVVAAVSYTLLEQPLRARRSERAGRVLLAPSD